MSEGRRDSRPPLPASTVAQGTRVESLGGAPRIVSEVENVPLALVDGEQSEASSKGMVLLISMYIYLIYTKSGIWAAYIV
jgi:hypothetical protein